MTYDKASCEHAIAQLSSAPLSLTDDDFRQLEIIGLEPRAREAVRQKQLALVDAPAPVERPTPSPEERTADANAAADILFDVLKKALDVRDARIGTLEAEVAALKARPLQKWAGVHVTGMHYSEASLVTKGGSLWVATSATATTPGEPGGDWRLIVKKGSAP